MDPVFQGLIVALASVLTTSGGFWTYLKNRDQKKSANTRLLMGLAQYRIITLGMKYIERGWVTKDEYDDLRRYFYEPYIELGGNGTADRVMGLVSSLPMRNPNIVPVLMHRTESE